MKKVKDFIFTYIINTEKRWINPHCFGKRWGIAIVSTYVVWLLFAFFQQEHYLFFPSRTKSNAPGPQSLNMELVSFSTQDNVRLTGAFLRNENSDEVILFFHENAGNISNYLGVFSLFEKLGKNALIFDYREFGVSGGKLRKEKDFLVDGRAAVDFLQKEKGFAPENITLWGKEMGAFFAAKMALENPKTSLVLENSLSDISTTIPWFLRYFVPRFLIKYSFDLESIVGRIQNRPLVIIQKEGNMLRESLRRQIPQQAQYLILPQKASKIGVFLEQLVPLLQKTTASTP